MTAACFLTTPNLSAHIAMQITAMQFHLLKSHSIKPACTREKHALVTRKDTRMHVASGAMLRRQELDINH